MSKNMNYFYFNFFCHSPVPLLSLFLALSLSLSRSLSRSLVYCRSPSSRILSSSETTRVKQPPRRGNRDNVRAIARQLGGKSRAIIPAVSRLFDSPL